MKRQNGAALLIALIVVVLAVTAGLLSAYNSRNSQAERDRITVEALAQAKAALIAYAVTYPEQNLGGSSIPVFVPGHLPCPDTNPSDCGNKGVSVIGLFPWKKLGLPPLRDAEGNCLWYAVSGSFKANNKPDLLNQDSTGQFVVLGEDGVTPLAGNTPSNRAVAIIFSAGSPVSGQNRSNDSSECGGDYNPQHFLDSQGGVNNASINATADAITTFIAGKRDNSFNDRLLWVTADDLFARGVELRKDLNTALYDTNYSTTNTPALAQRVAECLAFFGQSNSFSRLPWATPVTLPDLAQDTFDNDKFVDGINQLTGRVPFQIGKSQQTIGASKFTPTWLNTSCSGSVSASCRLLRIDHCPSGWNLVAGYPNSTDSPDGWWDKWKDHLFYAVAESFQPGTANANCSTPTIPGSKCLYVDGKGPFAAVVIFADKAQVSQSRATTAQKNDPANYMENENLLAIQASSGFDPNFGQFKQTGNNKFVCIRKDLTVDSLCQSP